MQNSNKNQVGITLVPQNTVTPSIDGDMRYNSTTNKIEIFDGSVDSLVTEAGTATLTNKDLSGNTATNLINGTGTLDLNSSGTVTIPNATDTLVGKATTDVLTNKDVDGGVASDSSRITLPSDTKANLDALTRKEATLVYATDTTSVYADNGSTLVQLAAATFGPFTDNHLIRADGTSNIQDSTAVLSDAGALSGLTQVSAGNVTLDTTGLSTSATNITLAPGGSAVTIINSDMQVKATSGQHSAIFFENTANGTHSVSLRAQDDITISDKTVLLPDFNTTVNIEATTDKSTTYNATMDDNFISCDATSAGFTINLPDATNFNGKTLFIKKVDATFNVITIDGNGSQTIDGALTTTLNTQYEAITIVAHGGNWDVLNRSIPSNWQSATFTFTGGLIGAGSNTQNSFIKRVGDSLECYVYWIPANTSSGQGNVVFPSGISLDTSKFTNDRTMFGTFVVNEANNVYGNTSRIGILVGNSGSPSQVYLARNGVGTSATAMSINTAWGGGSGFAMNFTIPVSGWNG